MRCQKAHGRATDKPVCHTATAIFNIEGSAAGTSPFVHIGETKGERNLEHEMCCGDSTEAEENGGVREKHSCVFSDGNDRLQC